MKKLLLNNNLSHKKNNMQKRNYIVLPNNFFTNKLEYKCVIPQNIFQTWHSKLLPPLMFNAVQKIKKINPRFHYKLYDDNDCRELIKKSK